MNDNIYCKLIKSIIKAKPFFLAEPHGIGDLPRPGIEPMSPALGAQSLNHWTTRKSSKTYFKSISKWEQILRGEEWILVATNLMLLCRILWLWRWVSITGKGQNGLQGFNHLLSSHHLLITDYSWNLGNFLFYHYIFIYFSGFRFKSTDLILIQPPDFSHLLGPPLGISQTLTAFGLEHFPQRFWIQNCYLSTQSGQGGVFWHHLPL